MCFVLRADLQGEAECRASHSLHPRQPSKGFSGCGIQGRRIAGFGFGFSVVCLIEFNSLNSYFPGEYPHLEDIEYKEMCPSVYSNTIVCLRAGSLISFAETQNKFFDLS